MSFEYFLHLDFDGVLHEDPGSQMIEIKKLFVHVPDFESCIREADPEFRLGIVFDTSFRIHESFDELKSHFSSDIAERMVGVTPIINPPCVGWGQSDKRGLRQLEIETWMHENAPGKPWIAIDDRREGFNNPCANLILCTPYEEDGRGLDEFSLRDLFWAIRALEEDLVNHNNYPKPY